MGREGAPSSHRRSSFAFAFAPASATRGRLHLPNRIHPRTISTMPHRSSPSQHSVSSAGSSTLDIRTAAAAPYSMFTMFGQCHTSIAPTSSSARGFHFPVGVPAASSTSANYRLPSVDSPFLDPFRAQVRHYGRLHAG